MTAQNFTTGSSSLYYNINYYNNDILVFTDIREYSKVGQKLEIKDCPSPLLTWQSEVPVHLPIMCSSPLQNCTIRSQSQFQSHNS